MPSVLTSTSSFKSATLGHVVVLDDEHSILSVLQEYLTLKGYECDTFDSANAFCDWLDQSVDKMPQPVCLLCDVSMPGMTGLEMLPKVKQMRPEVPVIMITGHGDIPLAVRAVKQGAFDFLEKPLNPQDLLGLLERACRQRSAVLARRSEIQATVDDELIGTSPQIVALRSQLNQLAQTDKDLLLEGPAGSGRHTLARLLHGLGLSAPQILAARRRLPGQQPADLEVAIHFGAVMVHGLEAADRPAELAPGLGVLEGRVEGFLGDGDV